MTRVPAVEHHLAVRVLNALLREDYGGVMSRLTHDKDGVALVLASGRRVRPVTGSPFQDFAVPAEPLEEGPVPGEPPAGGSARTGPLGLEEVLRTLEAVADPADAAGVSAFAAECREALAAAALHAAHRDAVAARLLREDGPRARGGASGVFYESLAAGLDHPIYPTGRCRLGISGDDLLAHAPEFGPRFDLAWAAVPRERVTPSEPRLPEWWPQPGDVGLCPRLAATHVLFPVHPLTVPVVDGLPWAEAAPKPYLTVRPTLSMRTVEVDERTHLKLPLPTSTLGLRNRRSIKPGTLRDGALAEQLLREILRREPGARVVLAGEQEYGHAGHEYLGWLVRRLPEGENVPVAALLARFPSPPGRRTTVLEHLAGRVHGGDVTALLRDYLGVLMRWNVTLFVEYGVALEAHQQNLSLLLGDGPPRLVVKDGDGLLASPDRLRRAGLAVPDFADERMLTDDPYALADVFVTITLHLAAMAVAHGAVPGAAPGLVREALTAALEPYGDDPAARLLRARTLDAARLVGKSMLVAGTLVGKERTGARDVNKFYGTTGPNYLRW
ncbi:IucA/IucC family protein [Microbispora sp. ATCC PTA-5024]|uniref:IucA/IucC family protein n=1 Tax=Microbispora sp. ATCC PTA-5024 TaxID=316330 RepID=UPI0003DC09AC|nr:IucA/IucC family protein [Microbispora sp. ATCC PTA-5024]ETK31264.1 siderophore biosynthesis protein [Microbispora sp. ATCC PTA-5024]